MLSNIASEPTARIAEFRVRNRRYEEKMVTPGAISDYEAQGWLIHRSLKTGVRMRKQRSGGQILEDRFWCCLYRLGYPELNEGRNFRIPVAGEVTKQIDVFAKDAETVVIAECKTSEDYRKKSLQKDLAEFQANKKPIADAIRAHYGRDFKPKIIWLFALDNMRLIPLSQADTKCGMRTKLSRRLGRSRRVAQWPKAYRFRSSKIRFPTKRAALHF